MRSQALIDYWNSVEVPRSIEVRRDYLPGELGEVWASVGMPVQDWWLFTFQFPKETDASNDLVEFGRWGDNWFLLWDRATGVCRARTHEGELVFINSSFEVFGEFLVLLDQAFRRIRQECPGDSGEDWEKGEVITSAMKEAMRQIDPEALPDSDDCFWPSLFLNFYL